MSPSQASATWCGLDLEWVYTELLGSIRRQLRCIERSQDVLHESLMRFVLIGERQVIEQPHAYLTTVVRSVIVSQYRETSRFIAADDAGWRASIGPSDTAPSAEHLVEVHQRLELAQQVIAALPPRCREVFWRYRIDGQSQSTIAASLGISVNMVERHVIRAMVDLRSLRERLLA